MSRIRKTTNIASLLKSVNHKLLHSTTTPDTRHGMICVLQQVLMDAGLYAGYGYITKSELESIGLHNELPGITHYDGITGAEVDSDTYYNELTARREAGKPVFGARHVQEFPDESRRFYYVHTAVHADYKKLEKDGEIPSTFHS